MATINQLVRKPRKRKVTKSGVPALQACPHSRLHHHPEEAELGFAKGLPRAAYQWV